MTGCATAPDAAHDLTWARIGQTVAVGGPKVTPLAIIEDSRCPAETRCVWPGRVRVFVRIDLGRGSETRELSQGMPMPVADGTLELVAIRPDKPRPTERLLAQGTYRLGVRFMGGL
jgi:hypothetical protein